MASSRTVLTTGDVAKICNVAPRTVSKWFDAGHLRGYRIPGSKDRRIPLEHLVRFMRAHGIPLNGLESGLRRVLIVDNDASLCAAIGEALNAENGFEAASAASAFEAGAMAQEFKPQVILVNTQLPDVIPAAMVRWCRSHSDLQHTCLIGMSAGLGAGHGEALLQQGFKGYLSKPFNVRRLIEIIDRSTAGAEELASQTAPTP